MSEKNSISEIRLVGEKALRRSPEIELERHRALSDMLHHNRFILNGYEDRQPYRIELELKGQSLVMRVNDSNDTPLEVITLGLKSLQKTIKDYFIMCESFFKIARSGDVGKIEAVDMGRRAVHNEGADALIQILEKYGICDALTARQLFTLICVLHIRIAKL